MQSGRNQALLNLEQLLVKFEHAMVSFFWRSILFAIAHFDLAIKISKVFTKFLCRWSIRPDSNRDVH
jgi:hypothetical protein